VRGNSIRHVLHAGAAVSRSCQVGDQ
jgi:hypothetical protein